MTCDHCCKFAKTTHISSLGVDLQICAECFKGFFEEAITPPYGPAVKKLAGIGMADYLMKQGLTAAAYRLIGEIIKKNENSVNKT